MKIAISYPALESVKGTPCLSQNRQFQWFNNATYIYPVVLAYAASWLQEKGHQVIWDDAIAEEISYEKWLERLLQIKPDMIVMETKTPVIKRHWKIIDEIKTKGANCGWQPTIVLLGDHVTALPEESLKACAVDFVLTGGDYDFSLLNLVDHLEQGTALEGGFWFRKPGGEIINSGSINYANHDLNQLPLIDRELTRWKLYAEKNGNFKYCPGAYMMSARDCWWGRCTFCSWTTLFPGKTFRTMSAQKALAEVENLINLGVKEIMEDSGSLPIGTWLEEFCQGMIDRGFNKKITISCNMRLNGITDPKIWQLMKKAGFRLILFGLESANQETLTQIDKNLQVKEIIPSLKICKTAGLEPHITTMIGYPWENEKMAQQTIEFSRKLFQQGLVDTLQATLVIPYPGTPLYRYCQQNELLLTDDYDQFDQRQPVMKTPIAAEKIKQLIQSLYATVFSFSFIYRKIKSIRSWSDCRYLLKSGNKLLHHLKDFRS